MMQHSRTNLWRNADFMKLWVGQSVSQWGSTITRDALPLTALLALNASGVEMGLLGAAGLAPVLLIGLFAGVWIDRMRRRPLMIAADLCRAALLISIPIAWLLGQLHMPQLYLVAALTGALTVVFDVAYLAMLPTLVQREQLVEGNSKLAASASLAEVGGAALAGGLVQLISGPFTILIDALSFVFSALTLRKIRTPEAAPPITQRASVRIEIAEGLRALWNNPWLRSISASLTIRTLFGSFFGAVYSLYALRELGIGPALLGIIIASGGIGALGGAMLAGMLGRRWGMGPALVGALGVMCGSSLLIALASREAGTAIVFMFAAQVIGDLAATVVGINETSLRQTITPQRLLGRVDASMRVLEGVAATTGLLIGGALADGFGSRATVWIAALGSLLAVVVLWASPVRRLEGLPREHAEQPTMREVVV